MQSCRSTLVPGYRPQMTYKVIAETTPDCDCADCRAGRHLYSLLRWRDGDWTYVGTCLQTYASAEDCMRNHWLGIQFQPEDVWEDGSPVVQPEPTASAEAMSEASGPRRMVQIDGGEFGKQMETLLKHFRDLPVD